MMLIDSVSFKLLEKLYECEEMTQAEAGEIVGGLERLDQHIDLLRAEQLAAPFTKGATPDGEGGLMGGVPYVRITLRGRAYVEQRRDGSIR